MLTTKEDESKKVSVVTELDAPKAIPKPLLSRKHPLGKFQKHK
jgi:hypothetical protein